MQFHAQALNCLRAAVRLKSPSLSGSICCFISKILWHCKPSLDSSEAQSSHALHEVNPAHMSSSFFTSEANRLSSNPVHQLDQRLATSHHSQASPPSQNNDKLITTPKNTNHPPCTTSSSTTITTVHLSCPLPLRISLRFPHSAICCARTS